VTGEAPPQSVEVVAWQGGWIPAAQGQTVDGSFYLEGLKPGPATLVSVMDWDWPGLGHVLYRAEMNVTVVSGGCVWVDMVLIEGG
jgi:hypothetical protein